MEKHSIHDKEAIQNFAQIAIEYCALMESSAPVTKEELVRSSFRLLARILIAGQALPNIPDEISTGETLFRSPWPKDDKIILKRLVHIFGEHNIYWEIFNPFRKEEPITDSLDDDLASIYGDIKEGLNAYQTGSDQGIIDAAWQWQTFYHIHWGNHIYDALKALHWLILNEFDCPDEPENQET